MSTVLIIDDEDHIRILLSRILKKEGYDVLEASDGVDGVALVKSAAIDLVITDIVMPNKEGIETISDIYDYDPNMKVIAMSGGGVHLNVETCLDVARMSGALKVLRKPFRIEEVTTVVSEILAA